MAKFSKIFLAGTILILLIIGSLILTKNNPLRIINRLLATTKEAFLNLFTFNQSEIVNLPVVEKEDSKKEENTEKAENFQKELDISPESDLDEIVEKLDEISEKIDVISQEVEKLIGKEREKETEKEAVEEEKTEKQEDKLKDLEEEIAEETKAPEKDIIICEKSGQSPVRDLVIFNEISWMGTSEDWRSEWFELKNTSGNDISLKNWQILDKNQEIKIVFEEKDNILLSQFFLLERTNDDAVPNISADKIYSGNLNDEDEILYLLDENCQLQDEILADLNWPAGDKNERKSMERDSDLTWYTYSGGGNYGIFGSPKAENGPKIVYISSGGGAPPPEEEVPAVPLLKILITEIFFDAEGSDEDQEFIELFNPNDSEVVISGHSIQYLSSSADSIDKVEKKNFEEGNKIESKSYFLLGLNGREGDLKWSQSLGNKGGTVILVNNKEKITGADDQNIVDRAGYGTGVGLILAETSAINLENFEAGKSLARKWLEETKEYQDSDNNQEDFEIQEPSPKDKNLTIVVPEFIDDIPPQISFDNLFSLQIETSFSLSWIGQDLALENVTPSGIDGFDLKYDIISTGSTVTPSDIDGIAIQYQDINNSWQDWVIGQILEFKENQNYANLLAEEGRTYYFQIKAKDKAGNESDWFEAKVEVNTLPVVINEIAWMGNEVSFNDEWLELFNNTDQDIDLTGWILKAADGTPEISLKGVIPAKSFYLLERTNDDTVPEITADQIYTGALGNSGEDFQIFNNSGKLIDSVILCEGKWCFGNNDTKQTMERKNPLLPGNNLENWADSQNPGGTPKSQNSNYLK